MKLKGAGEDFDPYQGEREGRHREVGCEAVWSLSSCKPGEPRTLCTTSLYTLYY